MDAVELPLRLRGIAEALRTRAAKAAADAMAQEFHVELTTVTLRKYTHGKLNATPSPPGEPPALVTGTLRRSARIVPALDGAARATASVRVGAVYARIQELGGDIYPKRAKALRFKVPVAGPLMPGKRRKQSWVTVKHVRLPKRPYMAPTRERLVSSGRLRDRGKQAAMDVIRNG